MKELIEKLKELIYHLDAVLNASGMPVQDCEECQALRSEIAVLESAEKSKTAEPSAEDEFAAIKFAIATIQFNNLAMSKNRDAIEANPATHKIAEYVCGLLNKERFAQSRQVPETTGKSAEEILNKKTLILAVEGAYSGDFPLVPYKDAIEAMHEFASQSVSDVVKELVEMEVCECGHTVPVEFSQFDGDCSTCINCVNDELIFRLGKKNKQIKSLKAKLSQHRSQIKSRTGNMREEKDESSLSIDYDKAIKEIGRLQKHIDELEEHLKLHTELD